MDVRLSALEEPVFEPATLASPLQAIVRRAGGVSVAHAGGPIIANYGSAAGELAACLSTVGIADRSQLTKLVLDGAATRIHDLVGEMTGADLVAGGAISAAGAWWCAESRGTTIILTDPSAGSAALLERLRAFARDAHSVSLTDHTHSWSALAVVGRRAPWVLRDLGVFGDAGDPRLTPPFTNQAVDGIEAMWLLESDDRALALVDRRAAGDLWHAIEQAGRRHGMCAIGEDALARYGLVRRGRQLA